MPVNGHRYAIEFYNEGWTRLGRQGVAVDPEPARECVRLHLLRRRPDVRESRFDAGQMIPRWSTRLGPPYLEGFRIESHGDNDETVGLDFPNTYFRGVAERAAAGLVVEGALREREAFRYLVMAFPADNDPPADIGTSVTAGAAPESRLSVRREPAPLVLIESSLHEMRRGARTAGDLDGADLPVFLPESLLREVRALTHEAGANECGGALVGHLHRDREVPELFVEVTAQVPARHTEATAQRLTFTPRTWQDLNATITRRSRGETMLGWWHSHPVGQWCGADQQDKPENLRLADGFMSTHDHVLHRTVFPSAYCVALVVSDPGHGAPNCTLFGWRQAEMLRRGYFIVPDCERSEWSETDTNQNPESEPEGV